MTRMPDDSALGGKPVIRYVNMVVADMVARDQDSAELSELSLPILQDKKDGPVEPPDFSAVVNRLKIMSNLNPVNYAEPKDGTVRLVFGGQPYTLETHFEDNADEPFCRLEIHKDDS